MRAAIQPGEVWLVGAGPGDPDLLTRKAARLLAEAGIVFHDALVGPGVLDLIPAGTQRVSVGKRAGRHAKDQSVICRMLLAAAQSGAAVVRLKGGDPAIFGRAAEEIAYLGAHGVRVHICPGITAASAAAATAGLSLTLRGQARALTFITAQTCAGDSLDLDWPSLAAKNTSLVVYMGRAAAPQIARRLIAAGRDGATPVLIAADISLPAERRVHTRLDALAFALMTTDPQAPTTLLIGEAFAAAEAPSAARLPQHVSTQGHSR